MSDIITLFPDELPSHSENYADLYREVYNQLQKDFHPYNELKKPETSLNAQWLLTEVTRLISELIRAKPQVLSAFLYRVDLPESQLRRAMQTTAPRKKLKN